jgi:hypothetical protein
MNLLDENIRQDQGQQLRKWRIPFRLLVRDVAGAGIQDPDIIPLLHCAKYPTFFTHDKDYFNRSLIHPAYCLVWLDLYDGDAALFTRRFLHHPRFNSHAKRMGKVVRVHPARIDSWQRGKQGQQSVAWPDLR